MIEQRIGGDLNLVEMNPLARVRQSDGDRVADEVHLMAARGKLNAELRGDHAGSAIRRVAGDSDFHEVWRTDRCAARWMRAWARRIRTGGAYCPFVPPCEASSPSL